MIIKDYWKLNIVNLIYTFYWLTCHHTNHKFPWCLKKLVIFQSRQWGSSLLYPYTCDLVISPMNNSGNFWGMKKTTWETHFGMQRIFGCVFRHICLLLTGIMLYLSKDFSSMETILQSFNLCHSRFNLLFYVLWSVGVLLLNSLGQTKVYSFWSMHLILWNLSFYYF